MNPKKVIEKAKKQLAELTGFKQPSGVGLEKEGEEWVATVEIVEKESIPEGMNILGTYEVRLDDEGKLIGYEKIAMRKKTDTEEFEGEVE